MRHALRSVIASVLLLAAIALPVSAQELTYTETTRMEMGGMMGAMMSMMGGMGDEQTETVYLEGTRMRRDSEETSTIMDLSTGDVVMLNHDDRTFVRMNFREMMEGMMDRSEEARARADSAMAATEARGEEMPEYEVSFSTDRTGETGTINGYDAEQVLMVVEFEGRVDEEETAQENPFAGMRMALVTELWLSTDFPEWSMMQELRDEMQEAWGDSGPFGGPEGSTMAPVPGMGERFRVAMEEQQEALQELEGTPVRTVMSWVSMAPDAELDPRAVVEQEVGGGGGAGAGAADAARSALRGLFGGGDEEEEEEPAAPVVMRMVTEVQDVESGPLDPALFEVPEGYTERSAPGMGG
jgi:hypothetical protein